MAVLAALADIVIERALADSGRVERRSIAATEHELVVLPFDLFNNDGSLDIYPDVLKLLSPTYNRDNRPAIQTTGWVGYIPLNESFALEITPRVPVGNLERLVAIARGYTPKILRKYTRQFAHAMEQPASLFDVLADQLLDAFDTVWELGLLKTYDRMKRVGSSPVGRVMPFESVWRTAKARRPLAVSSAFHRTADSSPNRVLRHAFEKLLARYINIGTEGQRARILRLKTAVERLSGAGLPTTSEIAPEAIAGYIRWLPVQHKDYADALMVAQLVLHDVGISIRGSGAVAMLPSILINMANVFEDYIRRVLADSLRGELGIVVKDGNKGGENGAKLPLFNPAAGGSADQNVTPDIVVEVAGKAQLIIDAKYKSGPNIPHRNDINQVILYGTRYGTDRVMVLHAGRPHGRGHAELCGSVGGIQVYNGMIDLGAEPIEAEETSFVQEVRALL